MTIANIKGIHIQMDADNKEDVFKILKKINEAIIDLDGEPQIMASHIDDSDIEFEPSDDDE